MIELDGKVKGPTALWRFSELSYRMSARIFRTLNKGSFFDWLNEPPPLSESEKKDLDQLRLAAREASLSLQKAAADNDGEKLTRVILRILDTPEKRAAMMSRSELKLIHKWFDDDFPGAYKANPLTKADQRMRTKP